MNRNHLAFAALALFAGTALAASLQLRQTPAQSVQPATALLPTEAHTVTLFEKAAPSTVFINTTATRQDFWSGQNVEVPAGSGSGFVWDQAGHIVTNFHVVRQAASAMVVFGDGTQKEARLVGVSPRHDIAVLAIDMGGVKAPPIAIGVSAGLRVGQNVYAIGNPFGLDHTLTTGIVSALHRQLRGADNQVIENLIQTDAAINPGNSGGPLLNSSGEVVGVNTAIYSPSGASAGIGFAIPADTVARVVPQIIAKGTYAPPKLGIVSDERIAALASQQLKVKGLAVLGVDKDSGAEAAGLEAAEKTRRGWVPHDLLQAIDEREITDTDSLLRALDAHQAGDKVKLKIWRAGKVVEKEAELK